MPVPWWLRWLVGGDRPMNRPIPLPPAPPPRADGESAPGLVAAVNAERAARGRPELIPNTRLGMLAADWAAQMAATGILDHGDFEDRIGVYFPGRASAENVAGGQAGPAEVVRSWMESPRHRGSMLGIYTMVGCGKAAGRDGRIFWVMDLVQ